MLFSPTFLSVRRHLHISVTQNYPPLKRLQPGMNLRISETETWSVHSACTAGESVYEDDKQ